MPEKKTYDNVVISLIDPDRFIRDTIKTILSNNGFKEFVQGATAQDILEQLEGEPPDLLIADSEITGGDFCELVHELWHKSFYADHRNNLESDFGTRQKSY